MHIRLKGRMKNEIIDAASRAGLTVNQYILVAIYTHLREERDIPPPTTAQFRIPTLEESIVAYMRGETVLQPCGQEKCEQVLTHLDGLTFCDTCNLRIQ